MGKTSVRINPAGRKRGRLRYAWGGVVFKGRQVFSEPPGGGSANMTPGPSPAALPGTGTGRARSDQTEQTPGAQQPRSSEPTGDSGHVNLAMRPQHSHFRSAGATAVLSRWPRGRGTPGSEKGGSLGTLGHPFPSPLRPPLRWAAEFSSSYMTRQTAHRSRY